MSEFVTTAEFSALQALVNRLLSKVSNLEAENRDLKATLNETQELLVIACRRTNVIENSIFAKNDDGDILKDSEDNPVIAESLSRISSEPISKQETIVPETTLDLKACAVVEHLKEAVKPNEFGVFAIDKKKLDTFLTEEISEDLRVKKVSRQLKKDIFKRAIELFSDIVYINVSPSGNKTKTLALKPSVKRTNTNACTRLTGLGIWA